MPPAEVSFNGLAFSPDGNYVYYSYIDKGGLLGTLYQVPSLGGTSRKLLAGVAGPVSFAPDGKQFAYLSWLPEEGEDLLMIANADGSNARKIVGRRGNEHFFSGTGAVSWSPDGKTIISPAGIWNPGSMTVVEVSAESGEVKFFTQQKWAWVGQVRWLADGKSVLITAQEKNSLQFQIWQVSYPSGEARRVTNDLNNYPSISFDANSDALVTLQAEAQANIWVTAANDTARATQTTQGKHFDNFPSWTPDGNVVYDSNTDGNANLYLMDARGGNVQQLTADTSSAFEPAVSPDGRYIAFTSKRSGGQHIWLISIDGSNPKQLTDNTDFSPQWSPDGQWIVYASVANNQNTIFKISLNGGQSIKLGGSKATIYSPTVSPDGKEIACYYQEEVNAPFKLAVLPFEGGEPTKTFELTGLSETNFRWTADGRAIVYAITRDSVSNLWAQPVDGGAPKQLTNFKDNLIFAFDFSRDGKQLALSRGTRTSDAVLITNFK